MVAAGAALETAFLPQRLWALRQDYGVRLTVALTRRASDFVTGTALRGVTGAAPYLEDAQFDGDVPMHLSLREADLLVVAPATGRVLSACALGVIDDPVTRLFAFTPKDRVVVAPALHPHLDRRLYVDHVARLRELGVAVLGGEDLFASWADVVAEVRDRLDLRVRFAGAGGPVLLEELPGRHR